MNSFIVRVELHGALTEAVYNQLHTAMEAANFTRIITADGGIRYWLPTAMYTTSSASTAESVRQVAATAVATTNLSAAIFVAQMSGWASSGLSAYRSLR